MLPFVRCCCCDRSITLYLFLHFFVCLNARSPCSVQYGGGYGGGGAGAGGGFAPPGAYGDPQQQPYMGGGANVGFMPPGVVEHRMGTTTKAAAAIRCSRRHQWDHTAAEAEAAALHRQESISSRSHRNHR